MRKRMILMTVALVVVFGGLFAYNFIKNYMMKQYFAHFEVPPVTVSTTVAELKNWQSELSAVGTFAAVQGIDVSAQVSGTVMAIYFNSGDYVKQGTPLIQIDDRVDQATLKSNEAALALQQVSFRRQVELSKKGATSASEVDEARANLKQAEALVENTKAILAEKRIVAPFSGILGVRQVDLGEYITPGTSRIVSLQSLDPLFLEFFLPEQDLTLLATHEKIHVSVESFPNKVFLGKITAIDSKSSPTTHNVLVQAMVSNCSVDDLLRKESTSTASTPVAEVQDCSKDKRIHRDITQYAFAPGLFADVHVLLPLKRNVIVLPATAITYTLYGDSVYIIKKEGKDPKGAPILKAYRRYVTTGETRGNEVVIEKGLSAKELVVSSGQIKLHEGTRVVIDNHITLNESQDLQGMGQ